MTKIIEMLVTEEMIEIAKKAIRMGLSSKDIVNLTDLDIETIQSLREQEAVENAE